MKTFFNTRYLSVIVIFSVLISLSFQTSKAVFTDISLGKVSEKTIYSPQTITYVDDQQTKIQKDELLSQIQEVYELNPVIQKEQTDLLNQFITSVSDSRKLMLEEQKSDEEINITKYFNSIKNNYNFKEEELKVFLNTPDDTLRMIKDILGKELENVYKPGITKEKLAETKEGFLNNTNFYFFGEKIRNSLVYVVAERITPNLTINEKETEARKKEALEGFQEAQITIQKGEIILREGEIINAKHLHTLEKLGLIKEEFNTKKMIHKIPFIFILLLALHLFMSKFNKEEMKNFRLYIFVYSVTTLAVLFSNFFQQAVVTQVFFVTSLILMTTFLSNHISIPYSMILGLLINTGDYLFLSLAMILGVILSLTYNSKNSKADRINYIYSGLLMGSILALSYIIFNLAIEPALDRDNLFILFASPIASSVIVLGLFPILEPILGVITSVKLYELTKNDHPLIKRLIEEAPGTYHHSLKVGNLAEAAAEKINANGLLLRVGAYFHDVGKLENPLYFVENLEGKSSPHQQLKPIESARIIKQHPTDSVKLCKKHRLPQIIIDLVEKHHGDTLVEYFYLEEKKNNPEVNESDFRYSTPLPKTREEGILLLADTVEAYSRTIMGKSPEEFSKAIKDLIYKKVQLGILRECELTMKEIEQIIKSFTTHLLRSNHQRIPYPEDTDDTKDKDNK